MEFRILGALEVWRAGDCVPVPAGRAQIALATLIAHRDQTVTAERLIRNCWGDDPPVTASTQIHAFISALRRQLGLARTASPTGLPALLTLSPGYRLSVAPEAVDAELFQARVAQARTAQTEGWHDQAVDHFRAALSLWRGDAFEGIPSQQLAAERMRLDQIRIAVFQELAAELLAAGRPADAAAELMPLIPNQPFHEGLRALLMVALNRSGRRADALAAYQSLRRSLTLELGIEPGADIQRLHRQILADPPPPPRQAPGAERSRISRTVIELADKSSHPRGDGAKKVVRRGSH